MQLLKGLEFFVLSIPVLLVFFFSQLIFVSDKTLCFTRMGYRFLKYSNRSHGLSQSADELRRIAQDLSSLCFQEYASCCPISCFSFAPLFVLIVVSNSSLHVFVSVCIALLAVFGCNCCLSPPCSFAVTMIQADLLRLPLFSILMR